MKIAATDHPRSRQEELGQFLTATPVADFMASMFGQLTDVSRKTPAHHWEVLVKAIIEAVITAGPMDEKRHKELQDLFAGSQAHLIFINAFETRRTTQAFVSQISRESEVWIAEDPDHMIHFNSQRFRGPYPDVMPRL